MGCLGMWWGVTSKTHSMSTMDLIQTRLGYSSENPSGIAWQNAYHHDVEYLLEQYAELRDDRDGKAFLKDAAEAKVRRIEEQLEAFRSALDEIAHTPSGRQKVTTLEGYMEADGVMRTIARNAIDAASSPATSSEGEASGDAVVASSVRSPSDPASEPS